MSAYAYLVRTSLFLRFDLVIPPIDLRMRDDEFATAVAGPLVDEGAQRVRVCAAFDSCGQRVSLFVKLLPVLGRAQYVRRHDPVRFHPVGSGRRSLSYPVAVKPPRANRIHLDRRSCQFLRGRCSIGDFQPRYFWQRKHTMFEAADLIFSRQSRVS